MAAYAAFRYRNYRFLLAGIVLSMLSQQTLSVVVAWDLYQTSHSPVVLGNVGLVQIIPILLLSLAAGHFADRYDRRRILVQTQAAAACIGVLLALAGAARGVALIYACLFLGSVARAFQWPASSSALPNVVPPEHLSNAIGWNGTGREMANVAGPAIAGFLIAWLGSTAVYALQAGCAFLTLICFAALRLPPISAASGPPGGRKQIGEGIRFVFREKLLLSAMSLDLLAVFFGGATALLPVYATDILHIGARGLGWLRAAPAFGAGSMAFVIAHRSRIRRAGPVLLIAVALFGAATMGFALSISPWLSFALLAAIGALDSVSVVLRTYLVHTRTPDALRGRVNAVNALFISCSNQWGAVESGLAAAWLGTVPSVVFGGAATIVVVAGIAAVSGSLWRWRNS
ncbi:MAG TPA: MFS transporter [Bryobacteraceae bacterium]